MCNKLKIGDFGLGKNINIIHSHQINETLAVGQYFYSSPDQMRGLKNTDKKSDVYSLEKIINYIFTKDSEDTSHTLKNISEIAIYKTPEFSYSVKEVAARILRYVAKDKNRFSSQRSIKALKIRGIEPSIEEILD